MRDDPVARLRQLCLGFPEASEKEAWGDPTFRVRDKIFAMPKRGDGRLSLWCKAAPGVQEAMAGFDPDRFFVPPYVGGYGWIGIRLDTEPDWDEIADLVRESYQLTAPKRLVARLTSAERDEPGKRG